GLMGSPVWGIPTLSIPRSWSAWRRAASLTPRAPATEWIAGVFGAATRAMACWTLSSRGKPSLGSLGLPTGTAVAKIKPAVGAELRAGARPNGAGQLLLPFIIGAMVGS